MQFENVDGSFREWHLKNIFDIGCSSGLQYQVKLLLAGTFTFTSVD